MPSECRQIELGRGDKVPEFKVEWEGSLIKIPVSYTRTCSMVAYAEVCGPADVLNDAWQDVVNCATAAAAAATIAAIILGPVVATPAFTASFSPCLVAKIQEKANEVQIALSTSQKADDDGEWHRVL